MTDNLPNAGWVPSYNGLNPSGTLIYATGNYEIIVRSPKGHENYWAWAIYEFLPPDTDAGRMCYHVPVCSDIGWTLAEAKDQSIARLRVLIEQRQGRRG